MLSMMNTHGNQFKVCTSTTTTILPSEFDRITRTRSSPEITAASLNEAERSSSSARKKLHGNAKRVYPFWKVCQNCSNVFPCKTKEQATRNKACGRTCAVAMMAKPRPQCVKPLSERLGKIIACAVCGTKVWKPDAWLKRTRIPTCSRHCNGVLRGKEWKKHAHKGHAAWSSESEDRLRQRMTGANNPAWKGGVTYFRKAGNYKPVKYVRCFPEFLSMARKDGYVMEHRLIVARAIGRCLIRKEVVHHVNHDPQVNDLDNLMLFASNRDHKLYEHHGIPEPTWRGSSHSTTKVASGA